MTKDATMPAPSDGGTVRGESEGEETRESEYFTEAEMASLDPKLQALARRNSKPGPFGLKTQLVWRKRIPYRGSARAHVVRRLPGFVRQVAVIRLVRDCGYVQRVRSDGGRSSPVDAPQLQGETAPENSPDVLRLRRHAELHPRLVT